jgi:hypothetical protein
MDCESSAAEALDRSQDVVGGFGPLERSGVRIASVDEGVDGRLQFCDRLMRSSLDLLLGEEAPPGLLGGPWAHSLASGCPNRLL